MPVVLDNVVLSRGTWSLAISGTIGPGIHLLAGAVGSGKSTLALALAGHHPPAAGTISRPGIRSCMISFQFPEYHITGATLAEEIQSWGLDPGTILGRERFSDRDDDDPLSLSRGELKRLHLACILSRDYDLLILDEPFSSLDCFEKERFCRIISARTGGITFIVTHEQSHFPRADYLWEIQGRQALYRGTIPGAIQHWNLAPPAIRSLVRAGRVPRNISQADLLEAACRT